jgi:serine/threonine-protein kinase RsbT
MEDTILFQKRFTIQGRDYARGGSASVEVKNILKETGFEPGVIRRVAIASYEAEMNVVMYGGGGIMELTIRPDTIYLTIQDEGPGIEDVEKAMQEGYSTATDEMREMGFGAGMGLPNIHRNADRMTIDTGSGKGTCLTLIFHTENRDD